MERKSYCYDNVNIIRQVSQETINHQRNNEKDPEDRTGSYRPLLGDAGVPPRPGIVLRM